MPEALLDFENVSVHYGAIQALDNVSLSVYPGEIVTLIGANGAGKSTLLMSLFSQPKISAGRIRFEGSCVESTPTHEMARKGVSIAPEGRRIFPKMTTLENIELGALHGDKTQLKPTLDKIYSLFPVLHKRAQQRAGTLSGGEQQMLAMARSLIASPKLFLLDEPSLGLAPQIAKQIFSILKEINQAGTTVFFVEQNAHAALTLAHRAYVLTNGKITAHGTGEELLKQHDIKKAYLGG